MRPYLLAFALLAATPALAADPGTTATPDAPGAAEAPGDTATPLTPSDFRHYAEGHTLYFSLDGKPYGSEAFGPEGESVWRFDEDGSCMAGVWRPYGGQLCFYYGEGADDDVNCWRLMKDANGMFVRLLGDTYDPADGSFELRITGRDEQAPKCEEPDYPAEPGSDGKPGEKT